MSLFTQTDSKDFKNQISQYKTLMESERLNESDVLLKKTYVEICSLKTDKTNYSYDELSSLLNIKADEVEMWAVEAITSKIIDAKIDQLNR